MHVFEVVLHCPGCNAKQCGLHKQPSEGQPWSSHDPGAQIPTLPLSCPSSCGAQISLGSQSLGSSQSTISLKLMGDPKM